MDDSLGGEKHFKVFKKLVPEGGESLFHLKEADAYREIAEATKGILPDFYLKAMHIAEEEEWLANKISDWETKTKYL